MSIKMNPLLYTDYYKTEHFRMYPEGMTKLYSNFTPRKSRIPGIDKVVVFGIQHFVQEYLIKAFNEEFFKKDKDAILLEYGKHIHVDLAHIGALHDLGYLPIKVKALAEGTLCPIGIPMMTITNTHPDFAWLVNYLETLISCMLWQPMTSATIAYEYKKILTKYAKETDVQNVEFVNWQGHDFSMRGMSSIESAVLSGMGHLLSFTGTDTVPAIYQLESSYNADGLIGASVPATEHSVMCMGTKEDEVNTFRRLLTLYPTGILSVVSDTWNLWDVCTKFLPELREEILARDGKLVIRPDSGDPVDILCGEASFDLTPLMDEYNLTEETLLRKIDKEMKHLIDNCDIKTFIYKGKTYSYGWDDYFYLTDYAKPKQKGVIELLWDIFGGTINDQGYKVLDPHIGAIYGDSITMERAIQICERLKAKGFASTNVVLGIGSFTYQYNTRDTFGSIIAGPLNQ